MLSATYSLKTPVFILLYGLFAGLLLSANLLLSDVTGYWVMITGYAVLFCIFYLFIFGYKKYIRRDLTIITSIRTGLPVFMLTLAVSWYLNSWGSTISYTSFGRFELAKEWLGFSLVMTGFFSFIFLPSYNWLSRLLPKKPGI